MTKNKRQFSLVLSKLTTNLPTNILFKLTMQKGILPFYHSISNKSLPHIKHLYKVKNAKQFESDLDFLLSHFNPIDLDTFLNADKLNRLSKPFFLLSFDDGLAEFYHIISPILLRKGIPAICFLNSEFVDNKNLFYRYKASLLIEEVTKNKTVTDKISRHFKNDKDFKTNILNLQYSNSYILDNIAKELHFNFDDFLLNEKPYLTTNQILELSLKGFHFGAHSVNHPLYNQIELNEQLSQTKDSINFIAKKFNPPFHTFSFPFTDYGVSEDFFSSLNNSTKIDATFGTAGLKKEKVANHFQRIPFELQNYSAKQLLNSELIYYLIKAPLGKNTIRRNKWK